MIPYIWRLRLEKSSHKLPPCPRLAESVGCQVGQIEIKVIFRGNSFPSPSLATTLSTRNASFLAHPLSSRILVDGDNHDLHYKSYLKRESVQHISIMTCVNVCLCGTDLPGVPLVVCGQQHPRRRSHCDSRSPPRKTCRLKQCGRSSPRREVSRAGALRGESACILGNLCHGVGCGGREAKTDREAWPRRIACK